MYRLFNIDPDHSVSVHSPPNWKLIHEGLSRNLAKVIHYYRRSPIAVNSSHLLVRLLHSITVPQSQEISRYYDNVDAIALNVAMALGLTSSIYTGRVHNGTFYGKGNSEIIIAHNDYFDYQWAHDNWKTLQPIKVVRQPRSDLMLNVPDGRNTGVEEGVVVVTINITMLAIQYRAFRLEEARFSMISGENQRSIYQFIHMYPLTNMLFSHMDSVIFNRLRNLEVGAPMGESTKPHSFALLNYEKYLNEYQTKLLELLRDRSRNFYNVLKNIPLIVKPSLAEYIVMPDVAATRQVTWAFTIGALPVLEFLFRTAKDSVLRTNAREVNRIVDRIHRYRQSGTMREVLPSELYVEYESTIDRLLEFIKEET